MHIASCLPTVSQLYTPILEFKFDSISIDTCRSMIALNDLGRIGKLGVEEFKELWTSVRLWKDAFKKRDHKRTGFINSFEMRDALEEAGIYCMFS